MNKKNETIKSIPYGISDYGIIRQGNYYYVDKTSYLKKIQQAGRYLFFIRPRRFGKSLLLSMMEAYYDTYYKDRFDELFKGTSIYDNPTEEKGKYLVLTFNFSNVEPAVEKIEASFLEHIRGRTLSFLRKYTDYLIKDREYFKKTIEESRSASDIMAALNDLCRDSRQKLYVLIDEYDNFANTILSTTGEADYKNLTHGEGFFRSFFNVLKAGTGGMDAPITRLLLTGVSPITLDDVTSGYNIGKNISVDSSLNRLLGFTEADVIEMIEYYREKGLIKHDTGFLTGILRQWYNHYNFSKESQTTLFNSDMVLYFLDEYFKVSRVPDELIDRNARMDYGKLRHLIIIDNKGKKESNGNFTRLQEIIREGEVSGKLKKGFPLEEIGLTENFISLLFYFGLLTIGGTKEGRVLFKIPNQTVKSLYYDYIIRISREIDLLNVNSTKLDSLLHDMAYHAKWQDYFDYIAGQMKESVSTRDFIREEKVIQGFLLAYLGISDYFIVHSEKELNMGYADIVMEPFIAKYEGIKYSYMIEIKYIAGEKKKNRAAMESKIRKLKIEAEEQLRKYAGDKKFKKTIGRTTLIKLIAIFSGPRLVYLGAVD
ncbi:MAG: AAA family ATPase [Candidatus Aminicenantes bacterium]|nr:AAA family ATPase [Candidatus Aminicenantes bacterium]